MAIKDDWFSRKYERIDQRRLTQQVRGLCANRHWGAPAISSTVLVNDSAKRPAKRGIPDGWCHGSRTDLVSRQGYGEEVDTVEHFPGRGFYAMNTDKSRLTYSAYVISEGQRTRQAISPFFGIVDEVLRNNLIRHDIGNREATTGLHYSEHFTEDFCFVRGEIDHAVRNHQINRAFLDRHSI